MFWKKRVNFQPIEILTQTVFLTATLSFVVFLLFDLLRPGFVSNVFSVHWFLLAAIVSGIWWGSVVKDKY